MKSRHFCFILFVCAFSVLAEGQVLQYFAPHVTAQEPWINQIVVYNNGDLEASFALTVWEANGQVAFQDDYMVPANGSLTLVMSNFNRYIPQDRIDVNNRKIQ